MSGKPRFQRNDLLVGPEILRDSTTELFLQFVFIGLDKPLNIFPAFLPFYEVFVFDGFGLRLKRYVEF